jgi:hypothetical protein
MDPSLPNSKNLARQVKEVLTVILETPEYGIPKILKQIYAKHRKKIVSQGGIQNLLAKLELNTGKKRKSFIKWARELPDWQVFELALITLRRYECEEELTPEERLKAIRLVEAGAP